MKYVPTPEMMDQINVRFSSRGQFGPHAIRRATVIEKARQFAHLLVETCPQGEELRNALACLEDSVALATQAISSEQLVENAISRARIADS